MQNAVKLTEFQISDDKKVSINTTLIQSFINSLNIKNNVKVITIVGNSRRGKSAFLNCLITVMKLYRSDMN
jgi:ABC-type histidine transport system ATPase subunit